MSSSSSSCTPIVFAADAFFFNIYFELQVTAEASRMTPAVGRWMEGVEAEPQGNLGFRN